MQKFKKSLFIFSTVLCLTPFMSAPLALVLGITFGLTLRHPWPELAPKITQKLLTWSIIGLGAGMDLRVVAQVGMSGFMYTVVGISITLLAGAVLGRVLRNSFATSTLLSVGTAICGGSAIAAVAPVIRAKDHEISVALATVFILNSLALVIFAPLGVFFGMSETSFGLWSALAIHDTSSVVGSAMQFGPRALEVATTVKLARALWIVPVTFIFAYFEKRRNASSNVKVKRPWFILGFLVAAAVFTWIPAVQPIGVVVTKIARQALVLTLFFIGAGLTLDKLKKVGIAPLIQGVLLWIFVSATSLSGIYLGWIKI